MKPTKQTVYLPVDGKDCDFIVRWYDDSYENDVKREEGYFFTPDQLNEYTQSVIEQALQTAAENADFGISQNDDGQEPWIHEDNIFVNRESITNTFDETFQKFEV